MACGLAVKWSLLVTFKLLRAFLKIYIVNADNACDWLIFGDDVFCHSNLFFGMFVCREWG